ncbi:MAG: hypothetical protein IT438_09550 [Phycisphaerales bacterium]|nr:hypothetical protein [Phycisphaerales bacterium]
MIARPLTLLLTASLLGGCAQSAGTLNNEVEIGRGSKQPGIGGGAFTPPPLSRSFNTPAELDDDRPPAPPAPEKSVWAVDRNNWPIKTLSVPNDRVEHQPVYTRSLHETTEPARNRGRYPTAMSALEPPSETGQAQQMLEAVEAPVAGLADIILFIPRAIWTPPWSDTRTGYEPYRRAPEMRGSIHPLKVAPTRTEQPDPASPPVRVPLGDYPPLDGPR